MTVTPHKLQDENFGRQWDEEVLDRWEYEDFRANKRWRRGWVSFDSLLSDPSDGRIYLGITSFDGDIFRAFDPATQVFADLGYSRVADPYDAKFHRSLVRWEHDGCLYGAVALLHDVNAYWDAPGGAIVRFDPSSGRIEKLGTPIPHHYIQSICLDTERGVLYGMTFTPERLFSFDIGSRATRDLGPISSGLAMAQGENIEIDTESRVWCGWAVTRAWQSEPGADSHRLCVVEPGADGIRFLETGLPRPDGSHGFVKVEGLFSLGPDRLYASGGNGSLYRVDPDTGRAGYLGTPIADRPSRLASLRLGPDGLAYGITGRAGRCEVIRFDPATEGWELLGSVESGGHRCWQVHDVAMTADGTIYAGENDNPFRSSYLWEVVL